MLGSCWISLKSVLMFGCIAHTGANNIFNNIDGLIYIKITLNILKPLLIPFVLGFIRTV